LTRRLESYSPLAMIAASSLGLLGWKKKLLLSSGGMPLMRSDGEQARYSSRVGMVI
jgi:hypothetical protein